MNNFTLAYSIIYNFQSFHGNYCEYSMSTNSVTNKVTADFGNRIA